MNLVWEPIIAAILALTSFSIKPNPKAPDAAAVLEYAVDDADVFFHVDWKATVADNYATFSKLPDDPIVSQVPELRDALRQAITKAESGRGMARATVGLDPVDDLSSLTGFARLKADGPPEFLVVIRGTFPADLASKVAKTGGKETTIDARPAATLPNDMMLGMSKGGALIAGKTEWVMPRIKDDWKAPARAKGSVWAKVATALDPHPFLLLASKPSAAAIKMMTKELSPGFAMDLVNGHELALFAASATGLGWVYQARDAALAKRIQLASDGLIGMLRAAHLAPRGIAQLAFAALPSYARSSKGIDAVLASKDKLMNAMWAMTGDGKFDAKVKLDGNTVTVAAKGKKLSDVAPASLLVGFGAIGFVASRKEAEAEAAAPAVKPKTPTRPSSGLGAPVKPTPKPGPKPAAPPHR